MIRITLFGTMVAIRRKMYSKACVVKYSKIVGYRCKNAKIALYCGSMHHLAIEAFMKNDSY